MSGSKNIGLVKAIHAGNTAPANTAIIWYNTLTFRHYYHNGTTWVLFGTGGGAGGTPALSVQINFGSQASINGKLNDLSVAPKFKKSTIPKPVIEQFRLAVDRNGNDGEIDIVWADVGGGMTAMDGATATLAVNESEGLFSFETTSVNPLGVYTLRATCTLGSYTFFQEFDVEII